MPIEYYFECNECHRWYTDSSAESEVPNVCIHCGPVPTSVDPPHNPESPF